MSTYGRNFWFLVTPESERRAGRYSVPTTGSVLPIGAPIKVNAAASATALGLQPVALATGAQAPLQGLSGILVYEYGPAAFAGNDPYLTTYSDKDTVPLGAAVQMVSGTYVKVCFKNTSTQTFLHTRTYPGRTMVNSGAGATPNVAVGQYLTPGTGDDTNGYWIATTDATKAWLVVTKVDTTLGEVEARMVF